MLKIHWLIIFIAWVLVSCADKVDEASNSENKVEIISTTEDTSSATVASESVQPPAEAAIPVKTAEPVVLDLSLPKDIHTNVEDWQEDEAGRYGVGEWFDKSDKKEEGRLKVKPKLRLKEGAEFSKDSNISSYGESVDGAEMGFEYKTR
ncbi:Uncharacterised protein [Zhongshania aliphaticivorans]|uniref:Uncharacterized protein n=1 Tax=Zhongshania aliphaticivorans TaxID=1470434 RepID=A0A5S9P0H7_9GAMM|nr:hypothetical protein [Zhongshania aliphaticivorans]CAA0089714.1 Uncharacterised protein [Zhongshania aliphaticivorans]CAA0096660.1 Uncharacterised protein [Zhongshania aliphaticivorans]